MSASYTLPIAIQDKEIEMRPNKLFALLCLLGVVATPAHAQEFRLSSNVVAEGNKLASAQVFRGFGCEGGNVSPHLAWSNAPQGTRSFAITVYDPDAPTGSGWWHWNIVNIPATVTELRSGISGSNELPVGALEIRNDYGSVGFGGACPPPGRMHRYIFTVSALKVEKLDLPANPSNALTGFMIQLNTIGQAKITASYNR